MKVCVLLLTYNHEEWIAQAVESVLVQETTFDYEIVIIEDCSTDSTRTIVVDYEQRYPEKIRLMLSERNRCDNTDFVAAFQNSSSQYVAWLDGDDYWTSPYKLQRQVDFLDTHPDYAICFHSVTILYENGSHEFWDRTEGKPKETSTLDDLWEGNFIPGCSSMLRKDSVGKFPEWYRTAKWADWALYVLAAQHGKIGYIHEVMGAYRVHSGGYWSGLSEIQKLEEAIAFYEIMDANLNFEYRETIRSKVAKLEGELEWRRARSND